MPERHHNYTGETARGNNCSKVSKPSDPNHNRPAHAQALLCTTDSDSNSLLATGPVD